MLNYRDLLAHSIVFESKDNSLKKVKWHVLSQLLLHKAFRFSSLFTRGHENAKARLYNTLPI